MKLKGLPFIFQTIYSHSKIVKNMWCYERHNCFSTSYLPESSKINLLLTFNCSQFLEKTVLLHYLIIYTSIHIHRNISHIHVLASEHFWNEMVFKQYRPLYLFIQFSLNDLVRLFIESYTAQACLELAVQPKMTERESPVQLSARNQTQESVSKASFPGKLSPLQMPLRRF